MSALNVAIVIPARYASSRLPGKPLLDIAGKPMIQYVIEAANRVKGVSSVTVATDDERIATVVQKLGTAVVLTSKDHSSGTDRLLEVAQSVVADVYINIQGDEPLVDVDDVSKLVAMMQDQKVACGTLCHEITVDEAANPNYVKVVMNDANEALYFSRSVIPFPREHTQQRFFKHIGVYAYSKELLANYPTAQQNSLETTESLEQLRLLSQGVKINMMVVKQAQAGVDTPACLEKVRRVILGLPEAKVILPKLVITDVDGVLTNGQLHYDANGEVMKTFHVRDGLGIKMLMSAGIRVAVLSGRDSPVLRKRLQDLGISSFLLGKSDKEQACLNLMAHAKVSMEETVYIGDDSIDLPAFTTCGTSYAVADAPEYIRRQADHVLTLKGGEGAFRELADQILMAYDLADNFSTAAGFLNHAHEMVQ